MEIRDWLELARIELRREEGQTMTEYGVLLALIAVGVIAVLWSSDRRSQPRSPTSRSSL